MAKKPTLNEQIQQLKNDIQFNKLNSFPIELRVVNTEGVEANKRYLRLGKTEVTLIREGRVTKRWFRKPQVEHYWQVKYCVTVYESNKENWQTGYNGYGFTFDEALVNALAKFGR